MNKIYVAEYLDDPDYPETTDTMEYASNNKLKLVMRLLKKKMIIHQHVQIRVFDLDTMEMLYTCYCLNLYSCIHSYCLNRHSCMHICKCMECKSKGDKTVQYLKENKKGN